MRNYELMRYILCKAATLKEPLSIGVFLNNYEFEEIQEEITRLNDEGLIQHSIVWEAYEIANGKITGITETGRAFLRNIENERVWLLIEQTLDAANLDLSYPLLKEVCEEIVRRYVMAKIPREL